MGTVERIEAGFEWDSFVQKSEQGTIFCGSDWLSLFDSLYQLYGYYKNGDLLGAICAFETPQPLTPFQGILLAPFQEGMKYTSQISLSNEIVSALVPYCPQEFYNHYTFTDIRPFKWAGYDCNVRYTYVVDENITKELLEKQTRYEINRYESGFIEGGIDLFDDFYGNTFLRKGIARTASSELIRRLYHVIPNHLYMTEDAGVIMIRDSKRSYYILGASRDGGSSAFCLWEAIKAEGREVDLVGCNDYNIHLFKRGFSGKLMAYYGVTNV